MYSELKGNFKKYRLNACILTIYGNALPGAFNIMAASLGVTTQQLDDMMRKGQVLASDALPKFAAMLNVITNDINLDSLQMSLNKLKNTWYELVENSGSEDIFNRIVRAADRAVGYISANIEDIKSLFKGLAISVAGIKLWDYFKLQGEKYIRDLELQLRGVEMSLRMSQKKVEKLIDSGAIQGPMKKREGGMIVGAGGSIDKDAYADIVRYNEQLIKANRLQHELYGTPLFDASQIRDVQAFHRSLGVIPETTKKITVATSALKKVWTGLGVVMKNVAKTFMQFLPMLAFTAVVTIITTAIDRAKRLREQIERINGLIDEQERKISDVKTRAQEQVTLMEGYMQALTDTNRTEDERLKTLNKINELMGTSFDASAIHETSDAYKELTRQTNLWGQSLAIAAELQAYAQSRADNLIAIEKIKAELVRKEAEYNKKTTVSRNWKGEYVRMNKLPFNGAQTLKKEMANDKKELEILQGLADGAVSKIAELETAYESIVTEMNKGRKGGGGGGESKLAKVLEKFNEDKAELTNKLREGAIQQEEFNKELDKLVLKYWESAAATGELSIKDILSKMDKGQALTAMEKWYKDLREAAETAARQVVLDGVAEAIAEEVEKAIEDESEALKKELEDWAEKDAKRVAADTAGMVHERTPLQTRDGLFDYKKSDREIFSEAANTARDNAKTLKEDIDAIKDEYDDAADAAQGVIDKLNEMEAEYKDLVKSAESLEQAARYAELIEDIKSMKKALAETITSGVKNLATSLDRCIKGAQELRDVFEDTDSSGWDKFMAVFNELVQVLDTFMGIMETVQKLGQITDQLNNAELAAQREKIVLLATELELRKQLQELKEKESSQTNKMIAQNLTAMATSKAAASASAGEAVAGATASGSKLPFPANLAAIAAGVGAVILALSKMNKFANGGIVGGNSFSGDKQMARVNSGEMVLNKAQQGHLWNILNGKGGTGGNVQFTIKGADLVGTLNNYNRLRK